MGIAVGRKDIASYRSHKATGSGAHKVRASVKYQLPFNLIVISINEVITNPCDRSITEICVNGHLANRKKWVTCNLTRIFNVSRVTANRDKSIVAYRA